MTAIEKISQWLVEKVDKVNPLNSRANGGFKTLKGINKYSERMNGFVFDAVQVLLQRFSSDSGGVPLGQAKLTEASAAIGRGLANKIGVELSTFKHLQVGDAMIGALHSNGYVNIFRDEAFSDWDGSAPYIIEVTEIFCDISDIPDIITKDLLRATSATKIPNVSGMIQSSGRSVIKNYTDAHMDHLLASITADAPWIQSLNKMQQQGWQINKEVLEVLLKNKDELKHVVPPRPNVGSPLKVKQAFERLKKKDTPHNRKRFNHETELWNIELASLKASSKNLETEIILKKAEELAEMGDFYQYVELDYRGRAYYQEPFMNYQGSDLARGLFLFNEGKVLTESGLKWLRIHTASSYNQSYNKDEIPEWCTHDYKKVLDDQGLESISVDKMTLADRERWTEENIIKILDDADKIVDCEKPIVYLACCNEWRGVAEAEEVGGTYYSKLPVPIDGSCNGYQHSGAIAKDGVTGELVSLMDTELQGDLYVAAAKELIKRMKPFFKARPFMKMKHIRKGIAKRGVMVRAYSAGKEKISDNMYKDCYAEGYTKLHNITMLDCMELGSELYDLIKDVCPGATKTMGFLQDLAMFDLGTFEVFENGKKINKSTKKKLHAAKQKLSKIKAEDMTKDQKEELNKIAKRLSNIETKLVRGNGNRHLEWYTPTQFKVIYEAYIQRKIKVRSTIPGYSGGEANQPGRVRHVLQEDSNMPNIQKFQAGIAPNFIHSMDACHMAYVISSWDGSFGAVHDSFSAHAADVEELSKLTRETFVDLYDVDDPYGDIAEMILNGDAVLDFTAPKYGTLDVKEVLKSKYFFC